METSIAHDARTGMELESLASNQTGTTEVDSLFNQEGRAIPDLHQRKPPHDRHGLIVTFILQLACFLWLAPIVTLLVLNFMPYVVGASAWCPNRKCNPGLFAPSLSITIENTERFDRQDHNLLGALQIVAKLLEIWFTLIAAALVSKMTFWLARRNEGLPVELLTRPFGFGDLPGTLVANPKGQDVSLESKSDLGYVSPNLEGDTISLQLESERYSKNSPLADSHIHCRHSIPFHSV
jgi:hypothetical protein